MLKCEICGKETSDPFHPCIIQEFLRIDGITCSYECSVIWLKRHNKEG